VFIHEMAVAPEIWAMKLQGLTQPVTTRSSRLLSMRRKPSKTAPILPRGFWLICSAKSTRQSPPRLAVAPHFPTADDTVACALMSVQAHCREIKVGGEHFVCIRFMVLARVPGPH